MMESPLTRFGVLRHAETRWNASHRIQGLQDSPLTAAGVSQALQWGRHLEDFRWDRMVASSAGRARRTAELIEYSSADSTCLRHASPGTGLGGAGPVNG